MTHNHLPIPLPPSPSGRGPGRGSTQPSFTYFFSLFSSSSSLPTPPRRDGRPARLLIVLYCLKTLQIEGTAIPNWFPRTHTQPEVTEAGYDAGAKQLFNFFLKELDQFLADDDLHPFGRTIIETCRDNATTTDYEHLLKDSPFNPEPAHAHTT